MLVKVWKICFFSALLLCGGLWQSPDAYAGRLSEFIIKCGVDEKGKGLDCNMADHDCLECTQKTTYLWIVASNTTTSYHCVPKGQSSVSGQDSCRNTGGRGGLTGDTTTKALAGMATVYQEDGQNCVTANLNAMYDGVCYSCIVIETLVSAFTTAGAKAYGASRQLANAVLVIATALWLAMYILKSVSSFTSVEPMKMINDIFVQLFKVMVAFVVVNAGIDVIVQYTIEPILNTGLDFGDAVLDAVETPLEENEKKSDAMWQELRGESG